jgi:hypothetical protein
MTKTKTFITKIAGISLALGMMAIGCEHSGKGATNLSKWAGTWNNLTVYFDDTEISAAIQAKAAAAGKSVDGIKKTLKDKRGHCLCILQNFRRCHYLL